MARLPDCPAPFFAAVIAWLSGHRCSTANASRPFAASTRVDVSLEYLRTRCVCVQLHCGWCLCLCAVLFLQHVLMAAACSDGCQDVRRVGHTMRPTVAGAAPLIVTNSICIIKILTLVPGRITRLMSCTVYTWPAWLLLHSTLAGVASVSQRQRASAGFTARCVARCCATCCFSCSV
jgi:hypothetical protein